jgi:hypothetical protein
VIYLPIAIMRSSILVLIITMARVSFITIMITITVRDQVGLVRRPRMLMMTALLVKTVK